MGLSPQNYRWKVIDRDGTPRYYRNARVAAGVADAFGTDYTIIKYRGDPAFPDETYHDATCVCRECSETWPVEGRLEDVQNATCPECSAENIFYPSYTVERVPPDDRL